MTSGNTASWFASNITEGIIPLNLAGHEEDRVTLKGELCRKDS
jgi:hypothetical protein